VPALLLSSLAFSLQATVSAFRMAYTRLFHNNNLPIGLNYFPVADM
jgi:hypothetical protein